MTHMFMIEPGIYTAFEDEAAQIDRCKEWGLLSDKATRTKTFTYKGYGRHMACSVVGYVDDMTAVIELENKHKHCIHPSYLKEMQASGFSQRIGTAGKEDSEDIEDQPVEAELAEDVSVEDEAAQEAKVEVSKAAVPEVEPAPAPAPAAAPAPAPAAKREKTAKIDLPEEKVQMTATVKEFTTVPNNFADTDDEVIIYESVAILEPPAEVGAAWSSHSATLKKLELEVGDTLTFEAKLVKKKLTRHPVPYKINNPSKIQKQGT